MPRKKKQPEADASETPDVQQKLDLTPEEMALSAEADALTAEAETEATDETPVVESEPEPEPEPAEIPEEPEADAEPEPVDVGKLQERMQTLESANSRMKRRVERDKRNRDRLEQIFAKTQQEQRPVQQAAPLSPTIAPHELVQDESGNYVIPQAVQEQILRQQQQQAAVPQPVDEATARFQFARGQQLQEYERIKDQLIERADDPEAVEELFESYREAADWLVSEVSTMPVDRPINSVRDLKRLLHDEGLDEDFADEFPDLDFDALVELNVNPSNRRLIRKVLRAHTNGQVGTNGAADADAADERPAARRRALNKPRAMSRKGTSSPRTATETITLDKVSKMSDDEILALRQSSPAFEQRFQEFLKETSEA